MKVNPKLVKRFNNRHDLDDVYAKYYPFEVGKIEDLNVGQLVKLQKDTVSGEPPAKGDLNDMRTVEVVDVDVSRWSRSEGSETFTVFLRDLSPVRVGERRGW